MPPSPNRSALLSVLSPLVNVPREAWKRLVNRIRGVADIGPKEAQALIRNQSALLLDVREQSEYETWRVSNALLIPLGTLTERVGELERFRDRPIAVLCHGGKRSATACWQLAELGFRNTYNIAGGILAWDKAGLPIER